MTRLEKIADDVLVLSDLVPADGRVNWLPADAEGFEPHNKFVVESRDSVLVIDTGVAAHEAGFMARLREVANGRKVVVLTTRNELECSGNLAAIADGFPDVFVLSPNGLPPLGLVHLQRRKREDFQTYRPKHGERLTVAGFERLEIVTPAIRLLGTGWVFDHVTRTLFTSDCFGADLMTTENSTVIRRNFEGLASMDFIRRTMLAKFDWLDRADTRSIEAYWDKLFTQLQPDAIAPGHGRVQLGRPVVERVAADYRMAVFGAKR